MKIKLKQLILNNKVEKETYILIFIYRRDDIFLCKYSNVSTTFNL